MTDVRDRVAVRASGGRSNPASRGRVKSGQSAPETTPVYRDRSYEFKSEVRQLFGPYLSRWA